MTAEIKPFVKAEKKISPLECNGIGRDADHDKAAVVYFNRPLTDDELRFVHDVCKRTVILMDGERP